MESNVANILSAEVKHLDQNAKKRYIEKLSNMGLSDPYLMPKSMFQPLKDVDNYPKVMFGDVYCYILHSKSSYTENDLRAYKSLRAYKYFVAGWVQDIEIFTKTVKNGHFYLVRAKVLHSQRLSDPPTKSWMWLKSNGCIQFGHCTCMAGLGEVCSHIAALVFALEAFRDFKQSQSSTSLPCKWLKPTQSSKIDYAEIASMDFTSPPRKRETDATCALRHQVMINKIMQPTKDEKCKFYKDLSKSNPTASVLSVLPEYCHNFTNPSDLPKPLNELYNSGNAKLCADDLDKLALETLAKIQVTAQQAENVERLTRKQSSSKKWFMYRTGRITASRVKSACAISIDKPSHSLVKSICYPFCYSFKSKATEWGCSHEKTALSSLEKEMMGKHNNFKLRECGFFISTEKDLSFLGASPDSLAECSCCGKGVVEVKCPYCKKDVSVLEAAEDKNFCLHELNGKLQLKRNHTYYYQIQLQMFVCNSSYCHFVVWTEQNEPFIETISFDYNFICSLMPKLSTFFSKVILHELLYKKFSQIETCAYESPVCYCKQDDPQKEIITCNGTACSIRLFHKQCMGLKFVSKKWMCTTCRTLAKAKSVPQKSKISVFTTQ